MADIDDRWIDVDFEAEPEYVFGDLGAATFGFPNYEQRFGVMSDAEIDAAIEKIDEDGGSLDRLVTRIFDQRQEGSCFPPGTRVRLADGTNAPIEKIRLLDEVLTAEGNIGRVTHLMARDAEESLIRLRLAGHGHLRMTSEHPVLTKRGYVKAEKLRIGDWVAIPRYLPSRNRYLFTSEHLPVRKLASREKMKGNQVKGVDAGSCKSVTVTKSPVPDMIELTPEFGRLLGLYLAEGSTSKQKVVWTFGLHEKETLAKEAIDLLRKSIGVEGRIQLRTCNNNCKVNVYGTQWARLFESLCGDHVSGKRPHADLMEGPEEFLGAMFDGWVAGDGWRQKDGSRVVGVTVSRDLALSMFDIANALGLRPCIQHSRPKPSGNVKTRKPRWDVVYTPGHGGKKDDARFSQLEDGCMWRRVRGIEEEDYSGPVFNMEVEGDNSYVAEGVGVHNCVANATSQAHQIKQAEQFGLEEVVQLSAMSLYKRIGRSPQSGAIVSDGWKEMKSRGILPLDTPENRAKFGGHVMPNTGWSTPFPSGWEATARKFAGLEAWNINTVPGLLTALCQGHPVVVGRQGHSICYCRPMRKGNRRVVKYANSWGSWGDKGYGYDTESQIREAARYAFAVRAVTGRN